MTDKDATGADALAVTISRIERTTLAIQTRPMETYDKEASTLADDVDDVVDALADARAEVERLSAAHVESERQLAAKHDEIGGLMDENAALRAALRELLGALDESADASEHADDVRAMLRYADAEKAARAALSVAES